jgi:hypothetical protein
MVTCITAPTEEKVNLVDEPACEPKNRMRNGHSGNKGAKKGVRRSEGCALELSRQGVGWSFIGPPR